MRHPEKQQKKIEHLWAAMKADPEKRRSHAESCRRWRQKQKAKAELQKIIERLQPGP